MAKQVFTQLISDLSGDEATDTKIIGVNGKWYELDVTDKEANEIDEFLSRLVSVARRHAGNGKAGGTKHVSNGAKSNGAGPDHKAARAWAIGNGLIEPGQRGRLRGDILAQYEASLTAPPALFDEGTETRPKRGRKRSSEPAGE